MSAQSAIVAREIVAAATAGSNIDARVVGGWLLLDAPARQSAAPSETLKRNASIAGPLKFVLTAAGEVRIRAEIPLEEESDVSAVVGELCAAFARMDGDGLPPSSDAPLPPETLKRLCQESGWTFTERTGDTLAVTLENAGGFRQAIVAPCRSGAQISVEFAASESLRDAAREAIAVLLLTAGGAVRLVVPAAEEREGQLVPRFRVGLSAGGGAAAVAHGLSALSVACRLCAEEITALHDETFAREYLAIRGRSDLIRPEPQQQKRKEAA